MFIVCVSVFVKPEYREAFIEATLENARNTRKEPKNIRFDVLQGSDDPDRFFLYEVYHDESGMDDHKTTSHYQKWREDVEEMMAKPREGIKHKNLFPETEEAFLSK
ncbi:MAG: antibiotic biosynthesis monooxygenase [Candidatus Heimdallarchaeota archaeon]|nr:MAG: antibiotic biosynthesis monooxygenase [Candidatus Heimdallarchaeota archaeon]